jgi:hypothetical protein
VPLTQHHSAFKRIAVVSDKDWVAHALHALAWMVPGELDCSASTSSSGPRSGPPADHTRHLTIVHRERPKQFSYTAISLSMAYRHAHGRKGVPDSSDEYAGTGNPPYSISLYASCGPIFGDADIGGAAAAD